MLPIAGVNVWIALGMLAGYITGKITGTDGANQSMTNLGVGVCAAMIGGAVVTFAQDSTRTNSGFGLSIVASIVTASVALAIYRTLHRGPSATVR